MGAGPPHTSPPKPVVVQDAAITESKIFACLQACHFEYRFSSGQSGFPLGSCWKSFVPRVNASQHLALENCDLEGALEEEAVNRGKLAVKWLRQTI